MKVSMICFSLTGLATGEKLQEAFEKNRDQVTLAKKSRYLPESIEESTQEWTGRQFQEAEAILFIGACGIAVRSIAPWVVGKKTDPAVLVIDECGKYVISLLSGHLGGANELASYAAKVLQATPVITTATDLHKRFAVDVFAKSHQCDILNLKAAKEVSAALLAGEPVGFYSDFPWEGEPPAGLVPCIKTENGYTPEVAVGISVTIDQEKIPFPSTTIVVPRIVSLGMGCKKGKEALAVKEAASECLERAGIYQEALECIASIDLKKEEPGLLTLAQEWNLPFLTYEKDQLLQAEGSFRDSSFVKEITGVDNVCERSAVLGSAQGTLIEKKTGGNGVTTALAVRKWRIQF